MNRREFLKQACVGAASLGCAAGYAADAPEADRPNVVLIFIDDMGYGDIGPFGSKRNKTPSLDRMAAEGIKFTEFYVSATACTPSRASLLTGCYADRVGMDGRVNFPAGRRGLNPAEVTIADLLKGRGYATGCFGKWHLGDQPQFLPLKQGFDEYFGIPYSNDMWRPNGKGKYPPLPVIKGAKPVAYVRDGADQSLLCKAFTDAAVSFIKRHRDKPFFVYLPHAYIHGPRFASKARLAKAGGNVTRAQIEEVDWSVGEILNTVKHLGLSKRTLVIFLSDNGGSRGTSMGPLRGGKGGPKYEGHMRTPTLAWWPGRIPAGRVTNEIGAAIDILPTVARLAGAQVPQDRIIDGEDISDLLLAVAGATSPHGVLFYEVDAVRKGKWKLVRSGGRWELYDLQTDLGERTNLAKKHPQQVAALRALLDTHAAALSKTRRKAAFVSDPKPLLASADGVPTLTKYLGLSKVVSLNDNENRNPEPK